mgnify:CR=1 FL=1
MLVRILIVEAMKDKVLRRAWTAQIQVRAERARRFRAKLAAVRFKTLWRVKMRRIPGGFDGLVRSRIRCALALFAAAALSGQKLKLP